MSFDIQRPPWPVYDEAGELVAAKDWLGNEFKTGDQVIYCITTSPGGRMAIGRIVAMELLVVPRRSGEWREVRVKVKTTRTSESWDFGPRTRPVWVTAANITALPIRLPLV